MADEQIVEPINILLSREELLLVLDLLQAETIPGLDPDPTLGDLTPDQRSLALTVAERALRARELVQVQDGGELIVHRRLLTAVGVCAYPNSAVLVYHWPSQADLPVRYFGHLRGNDIVAHSVPDSTLHLFSLLPSREQLVGQVLAVAQVEEVAAEAIEFSVPAAVLGQAREQANAAQAEAALATLTGSDVPAEAAQAFAASLSGGPRITILQLLKQQPGGAARQDITLLQNGSAAWLVSQPSTETDTLRVKTTTPAELSALLAGAL
ncbi:MAG: hypothetical protein Kow0031_35170 [Anaerolineae bacterium]